MAPSPNQNFSCLKAYAFWGVKLYAAAPASAKVEFLMNSLLDNGEKPSVLSAVLKYQTTEKARDIMMHAMDIHGGGAISKGPRNFLANPYQQIPIGITVEGSNTLTRSLIIFGQGLMRSHPYLYNIITSLEEDNTFIEFESADLLLNLTD